MRVLPVLQERGEQDGSRGGGAAAGARRSQPGRERKPPWLKVRAPGGERYLALRRLLRELELHTVCEEARCPNIGECWGGGTATIMLLGDVCTRGCRFCNVKSARTPPPPDPEEPHRVAEAIARTGLDYVVLTMVDRDDLPDGGAAHVAAAVRGIKRRAPEVLVEVLTGDFGGDPAAIAAVAHSGAEVLAHNLETVRRLQRRVRDVRSGYERSLAVLEQFKRERPQAHTKSSLMLGLGETEAELEEAFVDLRRVGVEILTLGQYLRPSPRHLPVVEYVPPERFAALEQRALGYGFAFVAAGPLVRSSYRAGELFLRSRLAGRPALGRAGSAPGC
ncbi:MAG: lipoyl synthase [Planctomycetota bacterium]|nr:MAG: lipoyl synthase [Planctomycetota bacterium]